ncbi:toxin C-terminal domain-containing protein [Rheinheimera baltica]|uniref:toxin C-terminal domain-containing protein n=1 Tax=Rheinheimera baltica TaxID=67576 RepID=UPI00273FF114|nr:toxin C-terminal domain-containing protein [Rheinheimera baltica]MDP5142142.1 toxin C-terminal domain-containing protein [Rheinheimera baltica]
MIVGRALFGAAKEFLWQVVIEGRSLGCVDYWQVGAAALQGAFTGGVGPRGIKAGKGEVFYKTTGEATAAAKKLGFEKIKSRVHDQAVYYNKKTKQYITRDVGSGDGKGSHNGGVWKIADSVKDLGSKNTRTGTVDAALNPVGG